MLSSSMLMTPWLGSSLMEIRLFSHMHICPPVMVFLSNLFYRGQNKKCSVDSHTTLVKCFCIFEWIYGGKSKMISSLFSNFQGSEQESKGLPCKKGIVQSVVGQGYHRKIILASQSMQNTMYRSVQLPINPHGSR